jgi:hypothetical protein
MRTMMMVAVLVLLAGAGPDRLRAQPKIKLPEGTTIDLGTVNRGEVITRELTVANTGTDTLLIEHVKTSCGCTGSMMSTPRIAPGESGVLRLTLDTRNLSGSVTKIVTITSNNSESRTTSIQLTATVREEIVLRPQQFWFKDAEVGRQASVELHLRNAGSDTLRLSGYRSTLEGLSVEVPGTPVAPGSEITLTAHFTPPRAMPVVADAIFLLTSNVRQPEVYIPVFGNAKEFRFDQTSP